MVPFVLLVELHNKDQVRSKFTYFFNYFVRTTRNVWIVLLLHFTIISTPPNVLNRTPSWIGTSSTNNPKHTTTTRSLSFIWCCHPQPLRGQNHVAATSDDFFFDVVSMSPAVRDWMLIWWEESGFGLDPTGRRQLYDGVCGQRRSKKWTHPQP